MYSYIENSHLATLKNVKITSDWQYHCVAKSQIELDSILIL